MLGELAPIFYLSPHADDVAFSCAGAVRADVLAGHDVTLITVFLSGAAAEARRAEDERAAALLGCRHLCLDIFDSPDRPEIRGRLGVFVPFGPPHLGIASEVVARLRWYLTKPSFVRAPLAVGAHIDHRIVHEAARSLALIEGHQLAYYEDQPYSLTPYALGRRLTGMSAQLRLPDGQPGQPLPGTQRATPRAERAAHRDSYRHLPLMRSAPPGVRFLVCQRLASLAYAADLSGHRPGRTPVLRPQLVEVSAHQALIADVIAAYASQWPLFAASPQALQQRLQTYAQSLSETPGVYQRLWFDESLSR